MARKPLLIVLSAIGAAALAVLVVGVIIGMHPNQTVRPPEAEPAQAAAPLTSHSPAVASNGKLTIRLLGGQADR